MNEIIFHALNDNGKFQTIIILVYTKELVMNEQEYQLLDNFYLLILVFAYLKCRVLEIMESSDHPLFVAELNNAVVRNELEPLELRTTGWNYGG